MTALQLRQLRSGASARHERWRRDFEARARALATATTRPDEAGRDTSPSGEMYELRLAEPGV
jgi:hypothetical protein